MDAVLGLLKRLAGPFGSRAQGGLRFRPWLTECESRIVPTVVDFFVTNGDDSGAGSLRQVYEDAVNPPVPYGNQARIIIDDAVAATGIALTSGPVIDNPVNLTSLEIVTEGGVQVVITGTGGFRFMNHTGNNGISFTFSNLTFGTPDGGAGTSFSAVASSFDAGDGGVIRTDGTLTLTGCVFNYGYAEGGGGAIYTTAGLTLTSCNFFNNTAVGSGGAVYSLPNGGGAGLTITDGSFLFNDSLDGSGGAIFYWVSVGTLHLSGGFQFMGNTAGLRGGAVFQQGGYLDATGGEFGFNTDGLDSPASGEYASELYLYHLYGVNLDAYVFYGASPDGNAIYLFSETPPTSPPLSRVVTDKVFGFIDTNWTLYP